MRQIRVRPRALGVLALLVITPAPAIGGDSLGELQGRFRQRYGQLVALKAGGVVGETWTGYVEVVPGTEPDAARQRLLAAENQDRTELYRIIARQSETTPERVGRRNALRSFGKAKPTEKLKGEDNRWRKQPDHARWMKLRTLMRSGKVGETADGQVSVVKPADGADPALRRLIGLENAWRARRYKAMARKDELPERAIIQREVRLNFQYARPGTFLRDASGAWRPKEGEKEREADEREAERGSATR